MNIYVAHLLARLLSVANTLGINRSKIEKFRSDAVDLDFYEQRIKKGISNLKYIFPELKANQNSSTMLEFGTGAHGIDFMIANLIGFKNIYTVDINNHLQLKWPKAADIFLKFEDDFKKLFEIEESEFKNRVAIIKSSQSIDEFLEHINCTYLNFDELRSGFSNGDKIDLWYSESNLQRIPLDDILRIFTIVGDEISENIVAFHRFDLKDIHTQPAYQLYAPKVHRFEFLKHNDVVWKILNSDRYSSQNRLRLPQYNEMFAGLGLSVVKGECLIHTGDEEILKQMKLANMFKYLSPKQLAVASARIIYSKSSNGKIPATFDDKVVYLKDNFEDENI